MDNDEVLRQRQWTEDELRSSKLKYYQPRKQRILARLVDKTVGVKKTLEVLTASKGDIMVYNPGDGTQRDTIDEYEHWPVRRDLFQSTYKLWSEKWTPNAAEKHLLDNGCIPYYKSTGVWAMRLDRPRLVQSLESPEPVEVPPGRWLVIGSEGEPYHTNDRVFRQRYLVEDE